MWFKKKSRPELPIPVEFAPVDVPVLDATKAALCLNNHLFIPARSHFSHETHCPCGEQSYMMLTKTGLFAKEKKIRKPAALPIPAPVAIRPAPVQITAFRKRARQ